MLASATVITGMVVLSYLAGGLGVIGLAFMAIGLFAPHVRAFALSAARGRLAPRACGGGCATTAATRVPICFGAEDAEQSLDPPLDRVDQLVRPVEPRQHVLVEPAEPGQLQQLGLGHLEHEGGDGDADELGQHQDDAGGDPLLVRQQPEAEQLERKQHAKRHDEHDQRGGRRQLANGAGEPGLDRPQRDARDDPGDDRLEMVPQPRLDQEDDRKQGSAAGGSIGARHKSKGSGRLK